MAAIALLGLACAQTSAQAGQVENATFGGSFHVRTTSLRELQFMRTVRQQFDFSCGSAALATLLTHHYQTPVTEAQVFQAMFDRGDQDRIRSEGFSLLDIKQYLESVGFVSDGVKATLAELAKVGIPAIVLVEDRGYRHFVVVKGVSNNDVIVGDPAGGLRRYTRERFETLWTNGLLFVIRNHQEAGRRNFNHAADWNSQPGAPAWRTVSTDTLSNVTLLRPRRSDF